MAPISRIVLALATVLVVACFRSTEAVASSNVRGRKDNTEGLAVAGGATLRDGNAKGSAAATRSELHDARVLSKKSSDSYDSYDKSDSSDSYDKSDSSDSYDHKSDSSDSYDHKSDSSDSYDKSDSSDSYDSKSSHDSYDSHHDSYDSHDSDSDDKKH